MLSFTVTRDQYGVLVGIAYWTAQMDYYHERYGKKEVDPEFDKMVDNVTSLFDEADRMGIPIWVQNKAVTFGSDWRVIEKYDLRGFLNKNGIIEQP